MSQTSTVPFSNLLYPKCWAAKEMGPPHRKIHLAGAGRNVGYMMSYPISSVKTRQGTDTIGSESITSEYHIPGSWLCHWPRDPFRCSIRPHLLLIGCSVTPSATPPVLTSYLRINKLGQLYLTFLCIYLILTVPLPPSRTSSCRTNKYWKLYISYYLLILI